MGKLSTSLDDRLQAWIAAQRLFFVATAPLTATGHVNCSPKGLDTFRVLSPQRVAYLDFAGSGVETIAHLRENGRICVMFCSFDAEPKILRLHGTGRAVEPGDAEWDGLLARFQPLPGPGQRAIVVVDVGRIAESCGYGVPVYEHRGERDRIAAWATAKGEGGLRDYQRKNNAQSLDGLPGLRWTGAAGHEPL